MTDNNLFLLNDDQRRQVLLQWENQQHEDFQVDFHITPFGEVLERFSVRKGVWNPVITTARHHAAYMFYNNGLFYGKDAIDVGCGTGIMGIVMGKYGARNVHMTDKSRPAAKNARENISNYGMESKASVTEGDLFSGVSRQADCITFNQPYFPGNPPEDDAIAASMLTPPDEIKRFLKDARCYLNRGGVIVMPSFSMAGDLNNPYVVGRECGYRVDTGFIADCITGLQRGKIAIHELRLK